METTERVHRTSRSPSSSLPPTPAEGGASESPLQRDLAAIAARAATLYERLLDERWQTTRPENGRDDDAPQGTRLAAWCRSAADGDNDRFDMRLAWDGLKRDAARELVTGVTLREGSDLPRWTDTLKAVLDTETAEAPSERDGGDLSTQIPFAEPLEVFVTTAVETLSSRVGNGIALLTDAALGNLRHALLTKLSQAAGQVLLLEFTRFKETRAQQTTPLYAANAPDARYLDFVGHCREGGWAEILSEWAVLARQLATLTDQWVDSTEELIARLTTDREEIATTFGIEVGPITAGATTLSDRHRGGRTVLVLTFESGDQIVYKPKDITIDAVYFELLRQINATAALPPFRIVNTLPRGDYGWQEPVSPKPCPDRESVRRFYKRAGRQLALMHVLNGTDGHCENFIAEDEHPVSIDLETLLSPSRETEALDSVRRTGMLPRWSGNEFEGRLDTTMLGCHPGQRHLLKRPRWRDVGSDAMTFEWVREPRGEDHHLPFVRAQGVRQGLSFGFEEEVVEGFQEMYSFILERRSELSKTLRSWQSIRVRYVDRDTRTYRRLLTHLSSPRFLRDGADWSIAAERLARREVLRRPAPPTTHTTTSDRPPAWKLYISEHADLMALDTPHFRIDADSQRVTCGSGASAGPLFDETPYNRLLFKWRSLNRNAIERHTTEIRSAFRSKTNPSRPMGGPQRVASSQHHPPERTDKIEPLLVAEYQRPRLSAWGTIETLTAGPIFPNTDMDGTGSSTI